uniref:(California timema) hypothetical protein n=1 Tax=Timema californicum TaxID=61474 RepID=A0A7R9IYU8_TIMCA|nr:unnamed protein product [Timema californicum]
MLVGLGKTMLEFVLNSKQNLSPRKAMLETFILCLADCDFDFEEELCPILRCYLAPLVKLLVNCGEYKMQCFVLEAILHLEADNTSLNRVFQIWPDVKQAFLSCTFQDFNKGSSNMWVDINCGPRTVSVQYLNPQSQKTRSSVIIIDHHKVANAALEKRFAVVNRYLIEIENEMQVMDAHQTQLKTFEQQLSRLREYITKMISSQSLSSKNVSHSLSQMHELHRKLCDELDKLESSHKNDLDTDMKSARDKSFDVMRQFWAHERKQAFLKMNSAIQAMLLC